MYHNNKGNKMKRKKWLAYYNYMKNNKKVIGIVNVSGFSEGEARVNFSSKYPKKELFHIHEDNNKN